MKACGVNKKVVKDREGWRERLRVADSILCRIGKDKKKINNY